MTIKTIFGENGQLGVGAIGTPTAQCGKGQCPAALIADNGDVFVQGYALDSAEGAALTAPTGEGFVRMPRATFEKIARQVLAA